MLGLRFNRLPLGQTAVVVYVEVLLEKDVLLRSVNIRSRTVVKDAFFVPLIALAIVYSRSEVNTADFQPKIFLARITQSAIAGRKPSPAGYTANDQISHTSDRPETGRHTRGPSYSAQCARRTTDDLCNA